MAKIFACNFLHTPDGPYILLHPDRLVIFQHVLRSRCVGVYIYRYRVFMFDVPGITTTLAKIALMIHQNEYVREEKRKREKQK